MQYMDEINEVKRAIIPASELNNIDIISIADELEGPGFSQLKNIKFGMKPQMY